MAALTQHLPTTDRSASITAGGTAQDVYTANQQPKAGFEFYNQSDTAMYLDWDTNATTSKGVLVAAGASFYMPGAAGVIPAGRMSVLCATTGKTFVCKTW
jgi:hypothetical protein